MKKKMSASGWLGVLLLAGLTAQGAEVFRDTFEDGSVGAWKIDGKGGAVVPQVVQGALTAAHGENGQLFLRQFEPRTLAVGESIELRWRARVYPFGASGNLLRVGFFHAGGKRIDGHTAYSDPVLAGLRGYAVFSANIRSNMQKNQPGGTVSLYERDKDHPVLIASAAFTKLQDQPGGMETMGNNAWTPVQEIRLTRTPTGYEVQTVLGGLEGYPPVRKSLSVSSATVTTFDTVALWYVSGNKAAEYSLKEVSLSVGR